MEFTYLKNGESLKIEASACIGCGICFDVCPHAVLEREAETGKAAVAHRARCMECGACALNCPAGAISVNHGVGCAAAIIGSMIRGGDASCDCGKACC